ncbi:mechanosensitive ion channel family protein [Wenzhouxiangella marina]|uniref:Small-conductance mechanosensitive channel n=1 Tax=Wenzhouxiangella marina TaxID=1579979 RepID=A0A0K0XY68_9GAMM|nr:mechanosensitive ion channel domain-containing protein [Wenzhouxiangella marina]AKS42572.1 Putative small-conductance mechanosensitive channel [Wenzhouxiangella marina]MBB6085646.1 small conductance mechanosensitive channel [Wenzhouxiangella marina]
MDALKTWFANLDTADILALAWQVIGALLIFIIGRWVAKALVKVLRRAMAKRQIDQLLVNFLANILYVFLLLSVVLISIGYLGIAVTPLIAVLGGAALAVGLALQSSLSNFASGLMLVGFRPFTTGHFVEAGGVSGTVKNVGIFQTELTTPDNRHIIVPNSEITSAPITNYSAFDTRRIDMIIGVSYDDDLKKAREVIERVVTAHEKVLKDPAPVFLLMDLADSSVNFAVRPWVATADYWVVRSELLESLKVELEAAGCSIPYPQRDVHLFQSGSAD